MNFGKILIICLHLFAYCNLQGQDWKTVGEKAIILVSQGKNAEAVKLTENAMKGGFPTLQDQGAITSLMYIKMAFDAQGKSSSYQTLVDGAYKNIKRELTGIKAKEGELSETYSTALSTAMLFYNYGGFSEDYVGVIQENQQIYLKKSNLEVQQRTQSIAQQKATSWDELNTIFEKLESNYKGMIEVYNRSSLNAPTSYSESYALGLAGISTAYGQLGQTAKSEEYLEKYSEHQYKNPELIAAQQQAEAEGALMKAQYAAAFNKGVIATGDLNNNESDMVQGMDQRLGVKKTDKIKTETDLVMENLMTQLGNMMDMSDVSPEEREQVDKMMNMAKASQNMSLSEQLKVAGEMGGLTEEEQKALTNEFDETLNQFAGMTDDLDGKYPNQSIDQKYDQIKKDTDKLINQGAQEDNPENIKKTYELAQESLKSMEWVQPIHVTVLKTIDPITKPESTDIQQIINAFEAKYAQTASAEEVKKASLNLTTSLKEVKALIQVEIDKTMASMPASMQNWNGTNMEANNEIVYMSFMAGAEKKDAFSALTPIMLEVYDDIGKLMGFNAISNLDKDADKIRAIAKNRQAHLNVYNKLLNAEGYAFDPYSDELDFQNLTFNYLIQQKDIDFITTKFVYDGVKSLNDAKLTEMYAELRKLRKDVGYMHLLTPAERLNLNYALEIQRSDSIKLKQLAQDVYLRVAGRTSFEQFAASYEIDWQKIQQTLNSEQVFVDVERIEDIADRSDVTYLFTIVKSEGNPQHMRIGGEKFAYEEAYFKRMYLKELSDLNGKATYTDTRIYDKFWKELQPFLQGKSQLFISPDGIYHQMSLEAIPLPTGQYLSDQMTIHRLSTVSNVIKLSQGQPIYFKPEGNFYLFGNPDFQLQSDRSAPEAAELKGQRAVSRLVGHIELVPLPGADNEVQRIYALMQSSNYPAHLYRGKDATEEAFNSIENPAVIHLATHGSFNAPSGNQSFQQQVMTDNPLLRSQVFLAGAAHARETGAYPWQDGILTAEEIFHQDLKNTKLVVLSACETGLGESLDGTGVFGLARAFQLAGAEATIMSLWVVDDAASMLLMKTLYENLIQNQMNLEAAFSAARSKVKEVYSHPRYWSAFVLMRG